MAEPPGGGAPTLWEKEEAARVKAHGERGNALEEYTKSLANTQADSHEAEEKRQIALAEQAVVDEGKRALHIEREAAASKKVAPFPTQPSDNNEPPAYPPLSARPPTHSSAHSPRSSR